MVMIDVGSPKTTREMLCSIQSVIQESVSAGVYSRTPHSTYDLMMLSSMIKQLDEHRPLGSDGKHGDLHTTTCGCLDGQLSEPKYQARPDVVLPSLMASQRRTGLARRCFWCGVELRWWQRNGCRLCRFSIRMNTPSPPCSQKERWDAEPDRWMISFATPYPTRAWLDGD